MRQDKVSQSSIPVKQFKFLAQDEKCLSRRKGKKGGKEMKERHKEERKEIEK